MRKLRPYLGSLALVAVIVLAVLARSTSTATLADRTPVGRVNDSVAEVRRGAGRIVFRTNLGQRIYQIDSTDDAVYQALRASIASRKAVVVRVTPYGAHFKANSDDIVNWVESLEFDGRTYGPFAAPRPWSWRSLPAEETALLRASALQLAWKYPEAIAQYDAALATGKLSAKRSARALRARVRACEAAAYPPGRAVNDADDALLVRALRDLQRAAQLDDADDAWSEALVLRKLGAYPEALAVYERIEHRAPEEYYRAVVARSSTYRQMRRYDDALRELDALAPRLGAQGGMPYNFNRASALNQLGRYEEAISAISQGLEIQPDFPRAFLVRACAKARLGQLDGARSDVRDGLAILERNGNSAAPHVAQQREQFTRARDVLAELKSGAALPVAEPPCGELYFQVDTSLRERSHLYSPAQTTAGAVPGAAAPSQVPLL